MNIIDEFREIMEFEPEDWQDTQSLRVIEKGFLVRLELLQEHLEQLREDRNLLEKDLEVITEPAIADLNKALINLYQSIIDKVENIFY